MSWLAGCRRLKRRYERTAEHFLAFVGIAAALIGYRRLAYANDQGPRCCPVAVTARWNRRKADQDPAEGLPPAPDALRPSIVGRCGTGGSVVTDQSGAR